MYVELMKNFPLADSNEQMAVRLILAPFAKNVWFLLSRHDVGTVHEKFSSPDSSDLLAVRLILVSSAQKMFDSYFLDMMYVEFKKNFPVVD